jgi:Glycosyltransferase
MPISVLEAMALGMPIVTTNAGGLKYMLEHKHNALFCNINDTEKMLQNIELLIDNRDLARMLSINSRKFAEKLSKDKVGFIWEEKISSLLNSSQT